MKYRYVKYTMEITTQRNLQDAGGKRSCQSGCSLHRLHLNASSFISAISNSSRYLLHVVGPLLISQNFRPFLYWGVTPFFDLTV